MQAFLPWAVLLDPRLADEWFFKRSMLKSKGMATSENEKGARKSKSTRSGGRMMLVIVIIL